MTSGDIRHETASSMTLQNSHQDWTTDPADSVYLSPSE